MTTIRTILLALLIVGSGLALRTAQAQPAIEDTDHARSTLAGETVKVVSDVPIPNLPGKRLVSVVVDYAPGAASTSHRHARSAFIYAYVLLGEVQSQVDDEPARVYGVGETWIEKPGAHHQVSRNASDTKPARLLAVFILDDADKQLTIPDGAEKQPEAPAQPEAMQDRKARSPRLHLP